MSFTALAGAATLSEMLLIAAILAWTFGGASQRAIAGPFLILLIDFTARALLLRVGMWSARRSVREVLASL